MKTLVVLASTIALTLVTNAQNLLLNGDFNSPASISAPENWQIWTYGGGWANHELLSPAGSVQGVYDGTYQMSIGGNGGAGGGIYQIVSGTAGLTYSLSVDGGAQNWWLPTGEVRLFFLDSSDATLHSRQITTTDAIHNPDQYDVGVAYQLWNITEVAPTGTTKVKVEFAGHGGGTTWFDNASLTVVPEPGSIGLLGVGMLSLALRKAGRKAA